jgi:hypothetical protein
MLCTLAQLRIAEHQRCENNLAQGKAQRRLGKVEQKVKALKVRHNRVPPLVSLFQSYVIYH